MTGTPGRFSFFTPFLLILLAFATPASAQEGVYAYTAAERIGFAFYHLTSNVEPPYEDWILASPVYQKAKNHMRPKILDDERRRLRNGFAINDPQRELIPIQTKVTLTFTDNPKFIEDGRDDPEAPVKIMTMSFRHAAEEGLYFPFSVGKMWIAFLPSGLDANMSYIVTRETYTQLEKYFNPGDDGISERVMAEIILRPVRADGESPLTLGGQATWLMTGEIASLSLLNTLGERVWDHMNDWYINKDEKELRQLKK